MLGSTGKLKQRELEYLGDLIEKKSRIKLSISTLKRLWRNDLPQLPHPSTLDALVSILDFKDWQDFKKQQFGNLPTAKDEVPLKENSRLTARLPLVAASAVILLVSGFFILQGFNKKENGIVVKGDVEFTADKTVSFGVPNTVMFHYDLSNVEADSFFIQQSWNPRDKARIDPDNNYYSAIYTPRVFILRGSWRMIQY